MNKTMLTAALLISFASIGLAAEQVHAAETTGSNVVSVTSCEQLSFGVRVSQNFGTPYILTNGIRDAGHGLRKYNLTCISSAQYHVFWETVTPVPPIPPPPQITPVTTTLSSNCPVSGCSIPFKSHTPTQTLIPAGYVHITSMSPSLQSATLLSIRAEVRGPLIHSFGGDNSLIVYAIHNGAVIGSNTFTRSFDAQGTYFQGILPLNPGMTLPNNAQQFISFQVNSSDNNLNFPAPPVFSLISTSITGYSYKDNATGVTVTKLENYPIVFTPGGMYAR